MEYIESGYIESGYFETSIVGIQGEAAIVASFSVAAELFDISDGGNDYLDATYVNPGYFEYVAPIVGIQAEAAVVASFVVAAELLDVSDGGNDYLDATYVNPGYFEYVAPASAFIEGAGVLLHNAQITAVANKIVEAVSNQTALASIVVIGGKNVEINLVAYSLGGMTTTADKFHGIVQTLASTTQQTANGGKLVLGEAGTISNTYVDSDYIINSYFDGTLTGGLVSFFTQSALIGKRQQGVIGNLTNDYVDPTYLDGGYFFGVSDVIITATLVGDLELVDTGFIEGSALLAGAFTSSPVITRQRDGVAVFETISNMAPIGFRIQETDASFEIISQFDSLAERARGTSAAFETEISLSTLNSRIRNNASVMSSEFQTTTFGQRARGIDLYAFAEGALVAQANVIRDSNTLANTFFNVGTDFIRTRNVSAEGDAIVFISNIPTRIRDTSLETQDAFSFDSVAVATRRISQSIVASFNSDNQFRLIRGYTANFSVQTTLDITPNVTREFDSAITSTSTQVSAAAKTAGGESGLLFESTIFARGNANLDCDIEAFGNGALITLGNARFRASIEMFSIPGFNMVTRNERVIKQQSHSIITLTSETVAVKIHPFVAEPFSSSMTTNIIGGRTSPTGANFTTSMSVQANGVVRFFFFPTTFTFGVVDEPLADTFFSRTRETGVNI